MFAEDTEFGRSAVTPIKMTNKKGIVPEKSREEIKAEREAKKAAKANAKAKAKSTKTSNKDPSDNNKPIPSNSIKIKKSNGIPETVTSKNIESPNEVLVLVSEPVPVPVPVISKTPNTCEKNEKIVLEISNEGKSKAALRAERRAKQEAQRAAKQQILSEKNKVRRKEEDNNNNNSNKPITHTTSVTDVVKKVSTQKKIIQKINTHEINLFKHLYHEREQAIADVSFVNSNIHPAIIRLGTQYASKVIVGSNARCVALLAAVKQLIQDFERPPQADFIRGFEANLQESVAYLHHCRPLAVSMQNALRHLKWQMTQFPSSLSDEDVSNFIYIFV